MSTCSNLGQLTFMRPGLLFSLFQKVESPTPGAPIPTRQDDGEISHGDSVSIMAVDSYIRAHRRPNLISDSVTSTRSLQGFELWSIVPNFPPLDQLSYPCGFR
ncbi:unnamed protein product [Cuscuta europaea]|nr:unnamed protein product [Cuscuta europaea]